MTSAADASKWHQQRRSKGWHGWRQQAHKARENAWGQATAHGSAWSEEMAREVRGARDQPYRNFERRVRSPTALRLSQFCRSAQEDLCGTFKTVIGAMFVAVMQTTIVCAVWNSLMTAAADPKPKDDGWVTSEVQRRKAAAVVVMAEAMLKKESH